MPDRNKRSGRRRPLLQHRVAPLVRSALFLAFVFSTGTIGFWLLGRPEHGFVDAVYMTTITLTTVGYAETIPLDAPAGKIFTVVLLVGGVGAFVNLLSNLTAFMVEGGIGTLLRQRRARRRLETSTGHYIVAGCGETGRHVVDELVRAGHRVVAIDVDPTGFRGLDPRALVIRGDAAEDAVLERAGIGRAAGLAASVGDDRDNLITVVSARRLAPGLRITARCSEHKTKRKLRAAGADDVISPNAIAAHRIVSSMARPRCLAFLERLALANPSAEVLFDASVHDASPIAGRTLGELRAQVDDRLLVLAIHQPGSLDEPGWIFSPGDDEQLTAGRAIVVIGRREVAKRLAAIGVG